MKDYENKQSNLGDLLLIFRRKIVEVLRREGLKQELTFSQVEILHFIGPTGKKTMKSIADYLRITPPSVTAIIQEMEEKKLIKRVNEKKDKRVVLIILTDMAKRRYVSISKKKEKILTTMVSKLSQKDRKAFERIIRIITSS